MKNLLSSLKRIIDSDAYKEWSSSNKDYYLTSFFRIIGDNEVDDWQIDFYNKSSDTLTSFLASEKPKLLQTGSKIFKPAHEMVSKLDIESVKVGLPEALIRVDKLLHEKYHGEKPNKKIVILQNVGKELWNITYLTSAFNIINVKIDARNGKVISDEIKSALSYK